METPKTGYQVQSYDVPVNDIAKPSIYAILRN